MYKIHRSIACPLDPFEDLSPTELLTLVGIFYRAAAASLSQAEKEQLRYDRYYSTAYEARELADSAMITLYWRLSDVSDSDELVLQLPYKHEWQRKNSGAASTE